MIALGFIIGAMLVFTLAVAFREFERWSDRRRIIDRRLHHHRTTLTSANPIIRPISTNTTRGISNPFMTGRAG